MSTPGSESTGKNTTQNLMQTLVNNPSLPSGTTFNPTLLNANTNEFMQGVQGTTQQTTNAATSQNPTTRNVAGKWENLSRDDQTAIARSMGLQDISQLTPFLNANPDQKQRWEQMQGSGQWTIPQTAQQIQASTVGGTSTVNTQEAPSIGHKDAQTYNASTIGNNTPQMQAVTGQVDPRALVTAEQGQYSKDTLSAYDGAPQGTVDRQSTVKGQYEDLMDFEAGQIPDWAKGAARTAQQQMAARGITNSTMAGEAITSALAQAALPIAAQDAQTFANMGIKNLDVKATATLAKAQALASMDMANLNNRQQAAVVNAQSFLQMQFKNMDNEQQSRALNQQARVQTLLSDQAAENAAKQFNAQSQNQMTQFYDSLNSQINMFNSEQRNAQERFNAAAINQTNQFNAAQTQSANTFNANAVNQNTQFTAQLNAQNEQFNAAQTNAVNQFNAQLRQQMEMFNTQNQLLVEQSNVQWRREINTANTAAQNAANQLNVTNTLNLSNTALNNLWQQMRDEADYAFTASQNSENRRHNLALAALQNEFNQNMMSAQQRNTLATLLGDTVGNILNNVIS